MCQIRFIKKDANRNILRDENIELSSSLSSVERPSYIEFIDGKTKSVLFEYAGSTEEYHRRFYNAIEIEYGSISGRIKCVRTDESLHQTDVYNLCQQQEKEFLSQRFEENFKGGLELARLILMKY